MAAISIGAVRPGTYHQGKCMAMNLLAGGGKSRETLSKFPPAKKNAGRRLPKSSAGRLKSRALSNQPRFSNPRRSYCAGMGSVFMTDWSGGAVTAAAGDLAGGGTVGPG